MSTTVDELKTLYVKLGGNIADVANLQTDAELIDKIEDLDLTAGRLPEVTADDNGDILSVVEGAWAKVESESELPAVTSADAGEVLTVNPSGAWAKAEPKGIPFSTSEVKIGEMGNMGVYQRTFKVNNIPFNGSKTIETGIDVHNYELSSDLTIINIFGTYRRSGMFNDVYMIDGTDGLIKLSVHVDYSHAIADGLIDLVVVSSGSGEPPTPEVTYIAAITIVYLKPTSN